MDQVTEATISPPACQACGTPVNPVEWAMSAGDGYPIHMVCVRARARVVGNGYRCVCRTRRYGRQVSNGSRSWLACDRCLGAIVQRA